MLFLAAASSVSNDKAASMTAAFGYRSERCVVFAVIMNDVRLWVVQRSERFSISTATKGLAVNETQHLLRSLAVRPRGCWPDQACVPVNLLVRMLNWPISNTKLEIHVQIPGCEMQHCCRQTGRKRVEKKDQLALHFMPNGSILFRTHIYAINRTSLSLSGAL